MHHADLLWLYASASVKVHIKVWTTDLKDCETFVFPCQPGDKLLVVKGFIKALEDKFTGNTFRMVPIGQNRYNVIPEVIHRA